MPDVAPEATFPAHSMVSRGVKAVYFDTILWSFQLSLAATMSTLPKPSLALRDFEYVSDDDIACMRVRLQQHLGPASVHVFGHIVDAVRRLCERSLLPPLAVLEELLA